MVQVLYSFVVADDIHALAPIADLNLLNKVLRTFESVGKPRVMSSPGEGCVFCDLLGRDAVLSGNDTYEN